VWGLEPRLLAIVKELNVRASLRPHAEEFEHFRKRLRLPAERTRLLTWQELLARAETTLDPPVRPLLTHARRLSILQPLD
jgi:hypothetical protein